MTWKEPTSKNTARVRAWRLANPERRDAAELKYRQSHRKEIAAKTKNWCDNRPDQARIKRETDRVNNYGLTPEMWSDLIESQDGLCAICWDVPAVHIDHDHKTGLVRGVLCQTCNIGLGHLRDDPRLLRSAADYISDRT